MAAGTPPVPAIADYGLIGDGRCAALVSRWGSIDWLCLPHFSAPALFGALLDPERGGHFAIRPRAPCRVERRYSANSAALETTFVTDTGRATLTDVLALPPSGNLAPMREVLRRIEGIAGRVELLIELLPRPRYGRVQPQPGYRAPLGWVWAWSDELLWLQSDWDLAAATAGDGGIRQTVSIGAGERCFVSLGYVSGGLAVAVPQGAAAQARLAATERAWGAWIGQCRYGGPYREAVLRSALTLKLLTYALSGAVVAAPSASLPEVPGGERNWDYRYCWLRDAALAMRAYTGLGYMEEAGRFLDWLLHTTRLTWPELQPVYDVYGRPDLAERTLGHWRGHGGSQPVRIGNRAHAQFQLDVYGSVLAAARNYVEFGGDLHGREARLLAGFARSLGRLWRQPDNGVWEIAEPRRQYTFSKMMAWIGVDSVLRLHAAGIPCATQSGLADLRADIEGEIETRGFLPRLGSYVGVLDGDQPDAALLLAACLGYRDPAHPRMRGTYDYLHRRLGRDGLLYRYAPDYDGLSGQEGAFGICCFAAVEHLARRGEAAAARQRFAGLLARANDLGLYGEELAPDGGALGNFPQAFTHIGLINAALALEAAP